MTDQKNELSKLCFTGFILSILSPILLLVTIAGVFNMLGDTFIWVLTAVILISTLDNRNCNCQKEEQKGQGFWHSGNHPAVHLCGCCHIHFLNWIFIHIGIK